MPCEVCGSLSGLDPELYEYFGVSVCHSCKTEESTNSDYRLITKTQAKKDFLLTEEELNDVKLLPSFTKKNPHNPRWSDMKLFLRKHVREFALTKFGSIEKLGEALDARAEANNEKKTRKFVKKLKGKVLQPVSFD